MKFENPKMNISMFEMESVEVTQASTNFTAAQEGAAAALNDYTNPSSTEATKRTEILTFTF